MADDFTPPPGPPPPKVPSGWAARWNNEYKEWFYVNIYTKKSQWDKPTEPVYPDSTDGAPSGPPPGYSGGSAHGVNSNPTDAKINPYDTATKDNTESDAELARRLQAEEDDRAKHGSTSRNAMQDYQNTPVPGRGSSYGQGQPPYGSQQDLPARDVKPKGFLGKLLGKASGGASGSPGYGQQQSYGGGGYGQPHYGGGYPPQGYQQQGYAGGPGYGGGPAYGAPYGGGGYGGGYPQQVPPKKSGGLGMAGGAALGLGGGLLGGMLLEDAIQDHDQNEYDQGYQQGTDNNGGGDYGGGDNGGGDYGGGDGGDFGGDGGGF